jgi:copper chaperone
MSTTTTLLVDGMTCGHCVSSVTSAVRKVQGVTEVAVDLPTGEVTVTADAPPDDAALRAAVTDAGFDLRT